MICGPRGKHWRLEEELSGVGPETEAPLESLTEDVGEVKVAFHPQVQPRA